MIEAVKRLENCFVLSKQLLCDIWTPDDHLLPHLLLKRTLTLCLEQVGTKRTVSQMQEDAAHPLATLSKRHWNHQP